MKQIMNLPLSSRLGLPTIPIYKVARKHRVSHTTYKCPVCHATGASEGPLDDFGRKARDAVGGLADSAHKTATAFWKNNRVPERLKETYATVDDTVKRTAVDIDTKFDLTSKAKQAASKVSQQAQEMDSRIGFKRRIRNLSDDVQRKAPLWKKQFNEFQKTFLGKVCVSIALAYLIGSGLAFRILNFMFILWWLLPLIMLPFSLFANRKAAQEAQRRAAEANARSARNPFFGGSSFFRQRPPPGPSQPRKYDDPQGSGPIIDVSYESLD